MESMESVVLSEAPFASGPACVACRESRPKVAGCTGRTLAQAWHLPWLSLRARDDGNPVTMWPDIRLLPPPPRKPAAFGSTPTREANARRERFWGSRVKRVPIAAGDSCPHIPDRKRLETPVRWASRSARSVRSPKAPADVERGLAFRPTPVRRSHPKAAAAR
jgi:hypothetical protein